jgi:RNA polymerase sigma-70 factor (ECF subfamily)
MAEGDTRAMEVAGAEGSAASRYPEDMALVCRCVEGDRVAWAQLLDEHDAVIHFTVRRVLLAHGGYAPDHAVEDIQADVILGLVRDNFARLRSWSGRCRLRSWLKVVAHHLTVDRLRRERSGVSLDDDRGAGWTLRQTLKAPGPDPEVRCVERDRIDRVFALAESLPEEDRLFLELFLVRGLGFEEIAAEMGSTLGGVYARKNRVRRKLSGLFARACQDLAAGSS